MSLGTGGRRRVSLPGLRMFHLRAGRSRDASEASLPPAVILERLLECVFIEVRPQNFREVQFRVGALPEQKVTQALLTAGAYQKIHWRRGRVGVIGGRQQLQERLRLL